MLHLCKLFTILDKRWAEQGNVWGGLGAAVGGAAGVFDRGELGHVFGDRDHNGYTFGNRGAADGFSEFARHAADGHIEGALEAGEQSTSDVEGAKKYSYFTQGSGPDGFYSKGYFGSNGYDHEDSKVAAIKDANGGAYRKGFETAGADTGLARSAWDKHSVGKQRHGLAFDHGAWGQGASEYGKAGRGDTWKGIRGDYLYDHQKSHHRRD
ncbi:unnamed protein product [Toxocara canis]|uniref:Uncharacterized protein n=1 Tax=Toxocara canis TaxID=6265 RepID=A0A3P7GN68_TOXCA|nr:unnamed protein product [Toxocara canis]